MDENRFAQAVGRLRAVAPQWQAVNGILLATAQSIDPADIHASIHQPAVANRLLEAADACTELASSLRLIARDLLKPPDAQT